MRIAYVLTEFPALSETFVATECDLLEREGVSVLPFTFRAPRYDDLLGPALKRWADRTVRPSPAALAALKRFAARFPSRVREATAVLTRYRAANMRERVATWGGLAWCAEAAEVMMAEGVQHVHAHFARGAATLAWLTSILAGLRFSFTAHAFGVYRSHPEALAAKVSAAAFARVTHRAVGERLRDAAGDSGRIVEIPTPMDFTAIERRPDGPPRRPLRILTVARVVPKKGVDLLPGVHQALVGLGVPSELHLYGPGTARSLRGQPGLHVHGPASHDRVLAEMRQADVLLLPCRIDPGGDRDGLPVVLLEAFASGLPAVSTRVAGIPELFEGPLAEQLATPDDVPDLARRIARLAANPALHTRVARDQHRIVHERFGLTAVRALRTHFESAA